MLTDNASETIKRFIVDKFPLARKRGINNDDQLLENGILDSMGVLEVVDFIEKEFQITVSDEDLLPENFQSIERLTAFVRERDKTGSKQHR